MINNIRTMREERGWTQEHLASLVQVSRQTINSLEMPDVPASNLFPHASCGCY
ncbi:MAG TPA: helix-turn-helix domain-containing protein [Syntrophomonadaceae bacterium]|nr:helix-turn-helix domain-containing protein [Syntrophomonadaceae bacterium]